jgi:NADPH:quinone reductase-like Zn-dependent oxidoreductase
MQAMVLPRFGGISEFVMAEVPVPPPAAGQALVKIKAAGINPGLGYCRADHRPGPWRAQVHAWRPHLRNEQFSPAG